MSDVLPALQATTSALADEEPYDGELASWVNAYLTRIAIADQSPEVNSSTRSSASWSGFLDGVRGNSLA